jgi:hypothetical protein
MHQQTLIYNIIDRKDLAHGDEPTAVTGSPQKDGGKLNTNGALSMLSSVS